MKNRLNTHRLSFVSAALAALSGRLGLVRFDVDLKDAAVVAAIAAAVAEATERLETKNAELLREKRALQKGATLDPAELERVERERDEWKGKHDALAKEHKTAAKDLEAARASLTSEQAFNQRLLVDNGLTAALTEAGVKNPAHLKAAAALLRSSAKIEVVADGDNRKAMIDGKALTDHVKAWAASEDGKHFVAAPNNAGGAAPGNKTPPAGTPAVPGALAGTSAVDRMHAAREAQAAAKTP